MKKANTRKNRNRTNYKTTKEQTPSATNSITKEDVPKKRQSFLMEIKKTNKITHTETMQKHYQSESDVNHCEYTLLKMGYEQPLVQKVLTKTNDLNEALDILQREGPEKNQKPHQETTLEHKSKKRPSDTPLDPSSSKRQKTTASLLTPKNSTPFKFIAEQEKSKKQTKKSCWESIFLGKEQARCPLCNSSEIKHNGQGTTFQQCHIIPKSQNGVCTSWNLLPGCGCNQNHGTQHLIDWMGLDGNKRNLLLPVFLRKYKSLIPPAMRDEHEDELVNFVRDLYKPKHLDKYETWLKLTKNHLKDILQ